MVENLKGSTILIGRESDNGRLLVSLMINGTAKTAAMGSAGSVPNCVSRCKPAEGVGHCKIVIDGGGNMTIVNNEACECHLCQRSGDSIEKNLRIEQRRAWQRQISSECKQHVGGCVEGC